MADTLPQATSPPNLRAESAALCEVSKSLVEAPDATVRYLLDIAHDLCGAGSAGLSLVRQNQTGEATVHWEVVSGALSAHEGTNAPSNCSPCGLCLEVGIAILISRPQLEFRHLADKSPLIAEILIAPLYDGGRTPFGTLWVAHHDSQRHFDSDDARIAKQLAAQLELALRLREQSRDHARALAVFESHQRAQQKLLAYDLYKERALFERAEIENRQALKFKDALIDEVNHRTKNTLQVASTLLAMQARASSSTQVREALLDGSTRLCVLATVHELLYANGNSTQDVSLPPLFQSLKDALVQLFGRTHPNVTLEIQCDQLALPAQDAAALALLANEAMTNAYKHAFVEDSAGMITVALSRTHEGALLLRIEDSGRGFPARHDGAGMGLTLMHTFATQLCGTLVVKPTALGSGSVITLTIPSRGKNEDA
jgi:two-component sensor histidine kinase